MKVQPGRLNAPAAGQVAGREIDRRRPLAFRLNGREIHGFAGDTLLSALFASGIDTAGRRNEQPIALDERFAPPVIARNLAHDLSRALPMERTPAVDGQEYTILGEVDRRITATGLAARVRRLLQPEISSLSLDLGRMSMTTGPWLDIYPQERLTADIVVVGGGVAGLSAAAVAGRLGDSVVLVEKTASLGGVTRLFGSTEGEDAPEVIIDKLKAKLAKLPNVRILTSAEAFEVTGNELRLHHVDMSDGTPAGRVIAIRSRRLVLATGALERLPVFPGNRLPGVSGLFAAFDRLERYGLWSGSQAILNTATNAGYRLAVMLGKAGVRIRRITDTRLDPRSRFIEFSKAYGMTLAPGRRIQSVEHAKSRSPLLSVHFSHVVGQKQLPPEQSAADRLVVSGPWQPDLTLWLAAGGRCAWDAAQGRLAPGGELEGIELAGAAAGYVSNTGCMQSGEAAVQALFGRAPRAIADLVIDPIYETPDDAVSIAAGESEAPVPTFLDYGNSLTQRPLPPPKKRNWFGSTRDGATRPFLRQQDHVLTLCDVAAAVELDLLQAEDAGALAEERTILPVDLLQRTSQGRHGHQRLDLVPHWLRGRFGQETEVWTITTDDQRALETGTLLHVNTDGTDPAKAIGVVLRPSAGTEPALALVGGARSAGERVVAKDVGGAVNIRLVAPHETKSEAIAASA